MNKIFNTKSECVYGILNAEKRNITEISRATGISRSQLTKWKSGKDIEVRIDSIYKLTNHLGLNVHFEPNQITINNTEDNNTNKEGTVEKQILYEHIQLLRDKVAQKTKEISHLEEERKMFKQNTYPIQSSEWSTLDFDFFSDVRISFLPFKRCVSKMSGDGVNQLAKRLGLSEDHLLNEYFSIGKYHSFNKHPVDKIVAPNNLKELKKLSINMPNLFDSLKTMIGEHYFRQVIIYQHNDVVVPSLCYIKINWFSNPVNAKCKTKFFTD